MLVWSAFVVALETTGGNGSVHLRFAAMNTRFARGLLWNYK